MMDYLFFLINFNLLVPSIKVFFQYNIQKLQYKKKNKIIPFPYKTLKKIHKQHERANFYTHQRNIANYVHYYVQCTQF